MTAQEPLTTPPGAQAPARTGAPAPQERRGSPLLEGVLAGSGLLSVLAVLLALAVGAVLIAVADPQVQKAAGYFLARPGDTLTAAWEIVRDSYTALWRGSVFNDQGRTPQRMWRPLTESLVFATPLILAGLGVTVAFRAGLFNIGAQGQIILGSILGAWVGFSLQLPVVLHLLVAGLGALLGGALWGGLAGLLKARTGANEVIVTIMLNWVAVYLLAYLLKQRAFQQGDSNQPLSPPTADTAAFPALLPEPFRLNAAFLLAVLATAAVWWFLRYSTTGFAARMLGSNPAAARTAGVSTGRVTVLVMALAGGLAGLAGASQVLGTERSLSGDVAGSFGFDAITVALLGRSRAWGTFWAGLLFGALKAGGFAMQSATSTPIDIILVVQSVIVLLIAAPPLVRTIFRLPDPAKRAHARAVARANAETASTTPTEA